MSEKSTAAFQLRTAISHAGLSLRQLAKRAHYAGASSIQRHLDSGADRFSTDIAQRFADALVGLGHPPLEHRAMMRQFAGVDQASQRKARVPGPPSSLLARPARTGTPIHVHPLTQSVRVCGMVQAGVWVEAAVWPEDQWYDVPVALAPWWVNYRQVGLEVKGPSMDIVYPQGTILICVDFTDIGREPRHGERVIVQRTRGDDVEATCKEYRRDGDGVPRLWPRSTHPDHQAPLRLDADGEVEIRITHRVIAAIVSEPL